MDWPSTHAPPSSDEWTREDWQEKADELLVQAASAVVAHPHDREVAEKARVLADRALGINFLHVGDDDFAFLTRWCEGHDPEQNAALVSAFMWDAPKGAE